MSDPSDRTATSPGDAPATTAAPALPAGAPLPAFTRPLAAAVAEAVVERLRGAFPQASAREPSRRRAAAGLLCARAAAARLAVGRDTLARIVKAGLLLPVPKGSRRAYRAADVEALIEHGYSLPDRSLIPPADHRSRRRAPKGEDAASIAEQLARF